MKKQTPQTRKTTTVLLLTTAIAFILTGIFGCSPPTASAPAAQASYSVNVTPIAAAGLETISADVTTSTESSTVTITVENLGTNRQVTLVAAGVTFTEGIKRADGTTTFEMPANAVDITATFAEVPFYNITFKIPGSSSASWAERAETIVESNGSVTATTPYHTAGEITGTATARAGSTVTIRAFLDHTITPKHQITTSAPGVTFATPRLVESAQTTTFTMPECDITINTTLADRQYAVTETATDNTGSEALTFSPTEPIEGETVTVSTTGMSDIRQVTISSTTAGVTFNKTILNKTILTTATDNNSATFTMPQGVVEVSAVYAARVYPITLNSNGNEPGESLAMTIGSTAITEAKSGDIITFTGNVNTGRQVRICAVGLNGVVFSPKVINTNGGTDTFTMPENAVALTAQYTSVPHAISINLTSYEAIWEEEESAVADLTSAVSGDTVTLTLKVKPTHEMVITTTSNGITFSQEVIRGVEGTTHITPVDVTFVMPANDAVINIEIFPRAHRVTINTDNHPNGSITTSVEWARPGDSVSFSYRTNSIDSHAPELLIQLGQSTIVSGLHASNNGSSSFTMPNNDVTLRFLWYTQL